MLDLKAVRIEFQDGRMAGKIVVKDKAKLISDKTMISMGWFLFSQGIRSRFHNLRKTYWEGVPE